LFRTITRPIQSLQRFRDVQTVLVRYGFDMLFEREEVQEIRKLLKEKLHLPVKDLEMKTFPERLRLMFEELGPTYVKLGQILSSRSDVLPEKWVVELSKLQDEVPAFSYEEVKGVFLEEFGKPPEELYYEFDRVPIAAASIGQVHRARLHNLQKVVVKVQRPGIKRQVESDIEIIREVARLFESRTAWGKQYGILAVVNEFAETLKAEMDYEIEAANANRLMRNMENVQGVYVPLTFPGLSTSRILTMEAVEGIKIDNLEALDEAGVDRKKVADVLIHSIFKQVLIDGFYQADPHPGNFLVETKTGTINYIDLGMMGVLGSGQRDLLSDVVLAIIQRDTHEIVKLAVELGAVSKEVDETRLERDFERILNKYIDLALEQISFASILQEILSILFKHRIRLPSEFSLGIKAIMQGEAVAHALNPDLIIMEIARSVARQVYFNRLVPKDIAFELVRNSRRLNRFLKMLPDVSESILKQVQNGELRVGLNVPDFDEQLNRIQNIANRMTAGLILAGTIIGSSIAMNVSPESWKYIPILGTIGFILSILLGGFLIWSTFWDLWSSSRRIRQIRKKKQKTSKS